MITTKRYDYIPFDAVREHPAIANHRALNAEKVKHYAEDILKNGLLEPLIVWERNGGEYFLVGGFHRVAAIRSIRANHPGYFDRIDVRVVSGEPDEMCALNLKLNADRLDARLVDYFDSVIYLNNANWTKEQIAAFIDKGVTLIDEILRYAPSMDKRLRRMLDENKISWNRCKGICRAALDAEPGREKSVVDAALAALNGEGASAAQPRPITMQKAVKRLAACAEKQPKTRYSVTHADLLALLSVLKGRTYSDEQLERVRSAFPALMEE